MPSAKATTDHDTIRKWVEQRGGHPAHVKRTGGKRSPGVLRIDYPGFSGEDSLEAIEWDEFFKAFDKNKLAFLYQGGRSRFSKLVDRATVKESSKTETKKRSAGTRGRGSAVKAKAKTTSTKTKTAKSKSASTRSRTSGTTTSHTTIKKWVEARGGHPACVKGTGRGKDPGVLRIDYPGYSGEDTLKEIDWDTFFEWFDRDKLAFVYSKSPRSRFSKLVSR